MDMGKEEENIDKFNDENFSNTMLLKDYLCFWMEEIVKKRVRPSTFERYHERINGYIIPELGEIPLCMLTTGQAQRFVDGLTRKGLAPSTVINVTKLLRSSVKEARGFGLIVENPCDELVMPNGNGISAPVLTKQEQLRLEEIAARMEQSVELSVLLSLYTGLSTGEVCALRWSDIELITGVLTVRCVLQRIKVFDVGGSKTVLMENAQKGKRSVRCIPLPSGLLDKLRKYGEGLPKDSYVLTGSRKPVEPRTLRLRFDKATIAAGVDVTYQILRRTYITRCLECDCDVETLSRMLGHESVHTTLNMQAYSAYEREKLVMEQVWTKMGNK